MDPIRLEDAVDRIETRALIDAYADTVSRRQWGDLVELFRPTATLDLDLRDRTLTLTGPTAVGDFIRDSIEQFAFFQFGVLGTRVQLRVGGDADRADMRTYMTELRQTHQGQWSTIYGVYHDRLVRTDARWWFEQRRYHSLARRDQPAVLFDFPDQLQLGQL